MSCGKGCKEITLLKGNGIVSTTDNLNGTFTILYDNGDTFTTSDFTGAAGAQGIQGIQGPAGTNGTNGVIVLKSLHPKATTVGILPQIIGDPLGYELIEWGAVLTGTILEMEFDIHSTGPVAATSAKLGFFLNKSNIYLPELSLGVLPLTIPDNDYQALNVKMTLTKNTNTEGYISLQASLTGNGSNGNVTNNKIWEMSKFIVLTTVATIKERIEVQVDPGSNPVTLDRVIIKLINPV